MSIQEQAQERLDNLWRTAAEFSAKSRAANFHEAAKRAAGESADLWLSGREEEAVAMRTVWSLLRAESERAWPMLGGEFLSGGTVEDAPTLPEPVAHMSDVG